VDLEYNRITTSEEIPPIPEPELSFLRGEIMKLLHPNVIGIDEMKAGIYSASEHFPKLSAKQWGEDHDLQLRWCLGANLFTTFHALFFHFERLVK